MNIAGKVNFKNLLLEFGLIIALLLIMIIISFLSPNFLTVPNMINLLKQVSINGILAIGVTFVILTSGIDLSVGSILAFSGIVSASFVTAGESNIFLAIILGVLAGLIFGLINGLIVAKGNVSPFIATLGTMAIARGATYIYNDGQPLSNLSDSFLSIGRNSVIGLPIPVWITIAIAIVCSIILYRTKFGRYVYAIGGNENAAKLSGVKVDRVKIAVYAISGILAGIAGVILTSRVSSGLPQAGLTYELDAIAAVVIGGTSLMGGRGRLWGTIVGALLIGVINNGLDLLGVSSYYQQLVKGAIIIAAVLVDQKRDGSR